MPLGELRSLSPDSVPSYGANDTPFFGKEGITLGDVVDIINPLQHIPFVSTLYEAITGDTKKMGSQLIGGALYGGPIGVVASAINIAFQQETGHDAIGAVAAAVIGESPEPQQLADATPAVPEVQVLAPKVNEEAAMDVDAIAQTPLAEILPPSKSTKHAQDVLSLFDAAALQAQHSYRKAQALNHQAVTTTRDLVM